MNFAPAVFYYAEKSATDNITNDLANVKKEVVMTYADMFRTPLSTSVSTIEGETLEVKAVTSGVANIQTGLGTHSDGGHMWWRNSAENAGQLELKFYAAEAISGNLTVTFTTAVDFGIVDLYLNDTLLQAGLDFYSSSLGTVNHTFNNISLPEGENMIKAVQKGKNASSTSTMFGIDVLTLANVIPTPMVVQTDNVLSWTVANETNITNFDVLNASNDSSLLSQLISADGSLSYQYTLSQGMSSKLKINLGASNHLIFTPKNGNSQSIDTGDDSAPMGGVTFGSTSGDLNIALTENTTGTTKDDCPVGLKLRLKKFWNVTSDGDETGTISFNTAELGMDTTDLSKLKLLFRADTQTRGIGQFTVVDSGDSPNASLDGNTLTFSSVNFGDGDYTLGATDDVLTPTIGLQISQFDAQLSWTVADEIDVAYYEVVVNGVVVETIQANGSGSYNVTLESGQIATLVVVDNSGFKQSFSSSNNNVVTQIYDLQKGWNLISITSDDADLETLKDETVGVLWGWDGLAYKVVETAEATDALWVYSPIAKQIYVSGTRSSATMNLSTGWNMVGPLENDYIPAEAHTVYSWSSVYDIIAGENKVLIGGKGYWIFSL